MVRPAIAWRQSAVDDSSPASRTGVWVGMAAIAMTFAAFTSAMIVRQGSSLRLAALHAAIGPVPRYRGPAGQQPGSGVGAQEVSALSFDGAQMRAVGSAALPVDDFRIGLVVCRRAIHGVAQAEIGRAVPGYHAQQLLLLSVYGAARSPRPGRTRGTDDGDLAVQQAAPTLRISTLSTVSYYWHFMDVLWIYLLLLLWMRI